MAAIDVIDIGGNKVSQIELSDEIFNVNVKKSVLHEVVKMQLANKRSGTACVKNRSDVRGSTRKLFRQKGTGNARPGSVRSPLRRGGGVIFGPHPKSWAISVPKKVRSLALKMALTTKYQDKSLIVINKIELEEIKTKKLLDIANTIKFEKALIIINEENQNLELSARNIPNIKVMRTEGLNVYDILKYDKLVVIENSVKGIEGRLS
jgi:large subunit ribosomal protein L4